LPPQVRSQAQAAHEEAAARIEADVNAGGPHGLWQLDVHGLHVSEATEAVERRLALLEWGAAPSCARLLRCPCAARPDAPPPAPHGRGAELAPALLSVLVPRRLQVQPL
jgi:hypothetical protein